VRRPAQHDGGGDDDRFSVGRSFFLCTTTAGARATGRLFAPDGAPAYDVEASRADGDRRRCRKRCCGGGRADELATAHTKHLRLVSIVIDGTMRYLLECVDGGGGGQGAGGGGGGGGGHRRCTLDEFIVAVLESLTSSHGLVWKQVASTVSCRGVSAFGGAPRQTCVDCSGRGAHVKPHVDIKAAAQGNGDYSAFVAASAAMADAMTEPSQLPCSPSSAMHA